VTPENTGNGRGKKGRKKEDSVDTGRILLVYTSLLLNG